MLMHGKSRSRDGIQSVTVSSIGSQVIRHYDRFIWFHCSNFSIGKKRKKFSGCVSLCLTVKFKGVHSALIYAMIAYIHT